MMCEYCEKQNKMTNAVKFDQKLKELNDEE